jgi:hypothetical protein
LSPYRGVRYHLKEVRQADQKPENAQELFNLRHSSLRNVIERIFGVLKRQWKILGGKGCEYSIDTQRDLFCALIGLYNFGKQCGEDDQFEDEEVVEDLLSQSDNLVGVDKTTRSVWDKRRDDIAAKMWSDYQEYIDQN